MVAQQLRYPVDQVLHLAVVEREHEGLAGREMAVQRAESHARRARDRRQGRLAGLGERGPGRGQDPLAVARHVGAGCGVRQAGPPGLVTWSLALQTERSPDSVGVADGEVSVSLWHGYPTGGEPA